MATYFVEGDVLVKVNIDVEADSLEEAESKAMKIFKTEIGMIDFVEAVVDYGAYAGQYDDEEYND